MHIIVMYDAFINLVLGSSIIVNRRSIHFKNKSAKNYVNHKKCSP